LSDRPNLTLVPQEAVEQPAPEPVADALVVPAARPAWTPPAVELTKPIPPFLVPPPRPEKPIGTVSLSENGESWIVEAEPQVTEMAKRLFHGSRALGHGKAVIPATRRNVGDLNWLMLRFPLAIRPEHEAAYAAMLRKAQEHSETLAQALEKPQRISPKLLKKPWPFQEEGIAHLVNNRRTLLADAPGLGKTIQAIGFLVHTQSWPALVVVPPHLVLNWAGTWGGSEYQGEIEKFLGKGCTVHVIRGHKPYDLPLAHVYVIHYLLLTHWRAALEKAKIGTIVFDEVQDLRHHETAKYSAASQIAGLAENVIGLSGTPIHGHGAEMWAVLNILEYHCLGDRDAFTREWCVHFGGSVVTDPEVLSSHLKREGLFLRRRAEDPGVLPHLPRKRRVIQQIGMDNALYAPLIDQAVAAALAVKDAKNHLDAKRLTRLAIEHSRQAIGVAKAPYVAAFVQALLEAGEPVLLFGHHHRVFAEYAERLAEWKPAEITGRAHVKDPKLRKQAEMAFENGDTNLIILGMRAGSGINLARGKIVVFGELDYAPAVHTQNEDRAAGGLRAQGKSSVLAYYLVCPEGSDREILDILGLKVSQFVGVMGDKPETEDDKVLAERMAEKHMASLLGRLQAMGKLPRRAPPPPSVLA
jgi:SNF2 family DNA or RNA helicase